MADGSEWQQMNYAPPQSFRVLIEHCWPAQTSCLRVQPLYKRKALGRLELLSLMASLPRTQYPKKRHLAKAQLGRQAPRTNEKGTHHK